MSIERLYKSQRNQKMSQPEDPLFEALYSEDTEEVSKETRFPKRA